MGNCLKSGSSSTVWAEDDGEEWEWLSPEKLIAERDRLLGDTNKQQHNNNHNNNISSSSFSSSSSSSSSSPSSSDNGELKIVISKKQLEQLLGGKWQNNNMQEDPVLARLLVDANNRSEMLRQRSWRPRLQSIPEVN